AGPQLVEPAVREAVQAGVRMSVSTPERPATRDLFPGADEYRGYLDRRRRKAIAFKMFCLAMLTIAVLALATLLYTIINDSFGLVAVVNQNDPDRIVAGL